MNSKIKNLILSATALALCCAIVITACFSLKTNNTETARAKAVETANVAASSEDSEEDEAADGKEEVIYIGMDASGTVTDINVVNIFNGSGSITDYGDYTCVKMLTTNDEISINADTVTFETDSDRIYYQGTLSADTALPWIISVKYYMNGIEFSADEIAGMSGELTIEIEISENTAYDGECDFYNTFLLQMALTLDTDYASNIVAEGATQANVGSDKQLSYMVIPGMGLEAEITADVTDFEMPSIEINGVALSLALDIDSEELEDSVDEIIDAIEQLNDGAGELSDGAGEIESGAGELNSGVSALSSGAASLDSGIDELVSGMETLKAGLDELDANSDELTEGSEQILEALEAIESALSAIDASSDELSQLSEASSLIQSGISELYSGILSLQSNLSFSNYKVVMAANGLDIDELVDANSEAIDQISELLTMLNTLRSYLPEETINRYLSALGIEDNIFDTLEGTASDLILLLTGNNAAISGMEAYLDAVCEGADELAAGAAELAESYDEFNSAIAELTDALSSMISQMAVLKSGIEALVSGYESLDTGIGEYTDGVAQIVSGYEQILSGMYTLSSGSSELAAGVSELSSGTGQLYTGSAALSSGAAELSDGTSEFYDEICEAQEELSDELSGLIDILTGDTEIYSFVSEKNTNVSSVQFVITTQAIEIEETETEEETEEEDSGLFDKLLDLFR